MADKRTVPGATVPVSPQESERGRMLNDYADLLELLGRELHAGTEQKYHRGFSIAQIRAAAVPPQQAWYPCKCGAEHSTPECPFTAVPPPPREEPAGLNIERAASIVLKAFEESEAAGYRSRDRQFAIDILRKSGAKE